MRFLHQILGTASGFRLMSYWWRSLIEKRRVSGIKDSTGELAKLIS